MSKNQKWSLKTHGIKVEEEAWEQSAIILKKIGMSRSQYLNLVLKYLVKSQTEAMMEVQEGLFRDIYGEVMKAKELEVTKKKKKKE